jgi:uncharacterized protein
LVFKVGGVMRLNTLYINGNVAPVSIKHAKSLMERTIGLIGKTLSENEAMLIYNCNSIHTFFMSFSIDAVFINSKGEVLNISRNIKPYRLIFPVPDASKALELKAGMATILKIKEKDRLSFN